MCVGFFADFKFHFTIISDFSWKVHRSAQIPRVLPLKIHTVYYSLSLLSVDVFVFIRRFAAHSTIQKLAVPKVPSTIRIAI